MNKQEIVLEIKKKKIEILQLQILLSKIPKEKSRGVLSVIDPIIFNKIIIEVEKGYSICDAIFKYGISRGTLYRPGYLSKIQRQELNIARISITGNRKQLRENEL